MSTATRSIACAGCLLLFALGCGSDASDGPSGGAGSSATAGAGGSSAGSPASSGASAGGAPSGGDESGGSTTPSTLGGSAGSAMAGSGGASAGNGGANNSGIAFKGVANSPCAARKALNVSWYYNWTQRESDACPDGKGGEFVPMIWGHPGAEQTGASINTAVTALLGKGYRYVLGFNEPDNATQSNIAVTTAISLLPNFNQAGMTVGTPATQANAAGQTWFKDYMARLAAGANLRDDFIAIHWYGWNAGSCDPSASQLESYIKYAEGFPGNRPIWLTEWSCLNQSAPTAAGVLAFYQGALAVFAKHPRLRRYAWYPWTTNCALTDASGALTPLGVAYAAAPATRPPP